jgi:hypothetical protein
MKTAVKKNVSGTLSFAPPEGAADSGSVEIYRPGDTVPYATLTATVSGGVLYRVYTAATVENLGRGYRARWQYAIGSRNYDRSVVFDVVASVLYPTVTGANGQAKLLDRYPILAGRLPPSESNYHDMIAIAWDDLDSMIRARALDPHSIVDPQPLEAVHLALTASYVARSYRPGSAATGVDWQAWAQDRIVEARELLDARLASIDWYDADQDLVPSSRELDRNQGAIRITR